MTVLLLMAAAASSGAAFEGRWNTPGNRSVVEISRRGQHLCGRIIFARPKPGTSTPPLDTENPDPQCRSRPLAGLQIMPGFSVNGADGTIYNPQNGKSYRSKMALAADGTLKVSGCVAIFCQTQIWVKAR
jgi:uncharacterized protein (DUF2147 family)